MTEYLDLLRLNRNYRNLWLARVISNLGDWFNLLASAALITSLTGSGAAVSFLFLARMLPIFFMSPFAGVLADRFDRRKLMVAADLGRAVTVAAFLLIRSPEQLWLLYVLTALQFVLSALYIPAHAALMPNIVESKELVAANALDGFTWSTMLAIGALLGGIAASLLGVDAAFVIDAATFVLSAWFVLLIRPQQIKVETNREPAKLLDFIDGLKYLWGRPFIFGLSLVKAGGALMWGATNVMEIPLAQLYPVGASASGSATLGIIYAATGIGTAIGPLICRRVFGDSRQGALRAITFSFGLFTFGVLLLGLAPTLTWVILSTLLRSLGSGTLWVYSSAELQTIVPDQLRGRVFAFEFAALTLTQSFSIIWAGAAYDRWNMSVQQVLMLAGGLGLCVSVVWLLFYWRFGVQPAPALEGE